MNGRVLLVEGDDAVRENFRALADAGYNIIEAGSIKTALMHLDVLDLSCVVLDLRLPNGHGRRVVEELKAKRDDVPVIILSSFHADEEWDFPVIKALEKPVNTEALVECVEKAFNQSEAIRSLRESTRRMQNYTGIA